MEDHSMFQTYIIGFIFLIIFYYIIKRPRIGANEPPLVPYTIPILGHTYDYLFHTKKLIKKCKEQYGECFSIYVFGRVMTIVSRSSLNEVFKSHDDFDLAISEMIPFHLVFEHSGGLDKVIHINARVAREEISGKFNIYTPIIQKYLLKGIDKWIGDCKEPKAIPRTWSMFNKITALPISNVLVGEEAASHDDVVKSLGDLAFDLGPLVAIPPILAFIHQKLHEFVITLPLRFGWNPISHHREVIINRIKPVIEKRLNEKKVLGNDYKPYNDALEWYMNRPDFDYTNSKKLLFYIDALFILTFGAIGTTSRTVTNALYDMAGRPEYLNELYEEALMIDKECNGSITFSDIEKMKKLDSFIKESLRHTDETLSLAHKVVPESFTFSNGYTIPKGRLVNLFMSDILKSKEAFGDDAEEFKPFRFVNAKSPATKVDRSYVVFGGGRRACPGRFFAINESKLILHKVILKYNIKTQNGNIENKVYIGPNTTPSRNPLIYENRK
ncbi:cytochrome P450 [Glomus cerebriforme]|uniref:Cytochrome P450 n=1 Tax=Glomus cerebriforme TaxID=658196 RepID=A0A397TIR6_9GLOM|nr:cytochrome P450 [Glomus cerebriforme]